MKWFASLLIASVFITHAGGRLLAQWSGIPQNIVEHMLYGGLLAALSALLLAVMLHMIESFWRDLALLALVVSILEGVQMAACIPWTLERLAQIPARTNLCDALTGQPVGATLLGLYAIAFGVVAWRWFGRDA